MGMFAVSNGLGVFCLSSPQSPQKSIKVLFFLSNIVASNSLHLLLLLFVSNYKYISNCVMFSYEPLVIKDRWVVAYSIMSKLSSSLYIINHLQLQ